MRWLIAKEELSAELAIPYPTSASGIIVSIKNAHRNLEEPPRLYFVITNRKRQGTSAFYMSHVYQNCQRPNGLG